MRIALSGTAVDGRREPLLEPVDLDWSTGEAVLVAAEPGHGHTALALVATGRLAPTTGTVTLDGARTAPAALRTVTAVVDVPGVTEPDDALTVADLAAEGLALAGRRALPGDVTRWLDAHDLSDLRRRRVDQLRPADRTRLLTRLAVADDAVRLVVLTLPDRHGGDPATWWALAQELALDGYGVLVGCTRPSARALGVDLPPATGDLHDPPVLALRRPAPTPVAPEADAPTDATTTTTEDLPA